MAAASLRFQSVSEEDLHKVFERLVDLNQNILDYSISVGIVIVDSGCALVNYHAIKISTYSYC